jgi:hypothetical protein
MKSSIIVLKVLVLSALLIISNNALALHDPVDRQQFFDLYLSWLSGFYDKAIYLTGYVVRAEWLPDSEFGMNKTSEGLR